MSNTDFTLKILADDVRDAVLADPFFAAIPAPAASAVAVTQDPQDINTDIASALQKIGISAMISLPEAQVEQSTNVPGPYFDDVRMTVVVSENVTINRGQGGPDIYTFCANLIRVLDMLPAASASELIRVVGLRKVDGGEYSTWNIFLRTAAGLKFDVATIAPVTVTKSDNGDGTSTVKLFCTTPGAPIWFTTDGSYPAPRNPAARLYLPFPVVLGSDESGSPIISSDGGELIATDTATLQALTLANGSRLKARAWLAGYAGGNQPQLETTI